ncbi:MAG: hypothetical protein HY321_02430 [Armatimonadetes bacterium]|nr:hypothetical protein [Armatimonadota bacterium]
MSRYALTVAATLGLLLVLAMPTACARDDRYDDLEEWISRTRFMVAAGYNSTGVVNFLTFREGKPEDGWNWQLLAAYPLQRPFFVEGGLTGWTLGRENQRAARRFGITAGAGLRMRDGMSELGAGIIPSGVRVFARRFLEPDVRGQGPVAHVAVVFPTLNGTRAFLDVGLGYTF